MFDVLNREPTECTDFLTTPGAGNRLTSQDSQTQAVPVETFMTNGPIVAIFWGGWRGMCISEPSRLPYDARRVHRRANALCGTTPGPAGYPPLPARARVFFLDFVAGAAPGLPR